MAFKTINVKSEFSLPKEGIGSGVITPGMLLERTAVVNTVKAHAQASKNQNRLVALERDIAGDDIDDDYATGEQILMRVFLPGDEVYMLLADGENVAAGDMLESNGDGYLKKYVVDSAGVVEYPNSIVGIALEAVDMSGSSAADPTGRILVEMM